MKFIAFGEIIYDCFEDSATLGGAPLNVAYHLTKLGAEGVMVSAVGDDAKGREALREIEARGIGTRDIFFSDYPTGVADVVMNGASADYTFNDPAAWDFIEADDSLFRESADLIFFGTLAQRNAVARYTLKKLLANVTAKEVFFDVNIRKQFYTDEIVLEGLKQCSILKMNSEEARLVLKIAGADTYDEKSAIEKLASAYSIRTILLTLGERGSFCYSNGTWYREAAGNTEVVDTVGAGASLSAGFLKTLLATNDVQKALHVGSRLADFVVSRKGATPEYSPELLDFLKANNVI